MHAAASPAGKQYDSTVLDLLLGSTS